MNSTMDLSIYLLLLFAVVAEVAATTALRFSKGFTRLAPSIVVIVGYATAFYSLSIVLRALPLGITYSIWAGLGTIGAIAAGFLLLRETPTPAQIGGIVLIIGGVLLVNLAGKHQSV